MNNIKKAQPVKVEISRVRQIIKEEIEAVSLLDQKMINEELSASQKKEVDHEGITKVTSSSSKLLTALAAFKENATESQIETSGKCIDELKKLLETMVEGPGRYVVSVKQGPTKVVLSNPNAVRRGISATHLSPKAVNS